MTPFSEKIISENMIRFHARQKGRFRLALKAGFEEMGYHPRVEIHRCLGKNRNVIVGDLGKAKVIFTAHYDTPPKMVVPNFILPRSIFLSILYQVVIGLLLLGLMFINGIAFAFCATVITSFFEVSDTILKTILGISGYLGILFTGYLILGVPNKNNYNDNTSGVVTLLEIAAKLPPKLRQEAAFVFFDREEWGTLGSAGFKKKYGKLLVNTPVINFDCVGDGKTIAVIIKKLVGDDVKKKLEAIKDERREVVFFPPKTTYYPSDHLNFCCGIEVAAFRKNRVWGYYLGRIHTKRDRFLDEENIAVLSDMMVRFTEGA